MEERLGEMRKGRRERIEKGSHCFFKSSGYDKLELKHKNLVFFKLRGLSQIIFPTVSVIMTLRGGGVGSLRA